MLASQIRSKRDDALFQALIAGAADGIIALDAQGHIQVFNSACERLFGYRPEEVMGKGLAMLLPSPYGEARDGLPPLTSRETLARRKDGSTFPIAISIGQARMEGGDITVGIIHDLAERGTVALADEARLSAMGQMGSALAHELNQPLAAVMNYVKAAQRTLEPSEDPRAAKSRELLDKAGEQVGRVGSIIRDLRNFIVRRERDRSTEDLRALIEEAVAFGLVGADADVAVKLALDPELAPILVDKLQIQQVIVNLVRNAVEAVRQTPVRQIDVESRIAGAGLAEVTIRDTGPGFSEGIRNRLFKPFVTTKEGGMGLGLTISQSIINAHGGRLWATPNAGDGVSFHFQLPFAEQTED